MHIDIEKVAQEIGIPVRMWAGNCHGISDAIVKADSLRHIGGPDQKYIVVRGHWTGPCEAGSYFGIRSGGPFVQHSWIEAPGLVLALAEAAPEIPFGVTAPWEMLPVFRRETYKPIIDPTRFAFNGKPPYIYVGPNDYYDAGGNAWRAANLPTLLPYDGTKKQIKLDVSHAVHGWVQLQTEQHGNEYPYATYTYELVMWLANLPLSMLGEMARPIFRAIVKAGHAAAIPIDNRLMVLGVDL